MDDDHMTTDWKWRVLAFLPVGDMTTGRRRALAQLFVTHGTSKLDEELKMFDLAARFSSTGEEPAEYLGFNTAAKTGLRTAITALLDTLPDARYAVIANTDLPDDGYADGELVATNFANAVVGEPASREDVTGWLEAELGQIEILEELEV